MGDEGGFAEAIWALARTVPPGRATTYGDIAEAHFGVRKGARAVGGAMAGCPDDVPWWRVVRADGQAMPGPSGEEQRARLREEAVPLTLDGRVDWAAAGGPFSPPASSPEAREAVPVRFGRVRPDSAKLGR